MDELVFTPMCVSHELNDLEKIPHRDIDGTDLAIVARDENGFVNGIFADGKELTDEDVISLTEKNYIHCKPITMGELLGMSEYQNTDEFKLYVLGLDAPRFGAAVMGCMDDLKEAKDVLGEGYYILPSSVHEVLLIPDSCFGDLTPESMQEMVKEVNESDVLPGEVLSNSVYHFDGEKLTTAAGPALEYLKNKDSGIGEKE